MAKVSNSDFKTQGGKKAQTSTTRRGGNIANSKAWNPALNKGHDVHTTGGK